MRKNKTRLIVAVILSLFLILLSAPAAFAENSDDSMAGQKPLNFMSATLVDGGNIANATDIPVQPKLKLVFDKNIVNSVVWDNNKGCFSLVSEDNQNVAINVTRIDDTVDTNEKQNVYIETVSALDPGTTYYLKVSPALKAKNGNSTLGDTTGGNGVTITFKTAGQQPANPDQQNDQDNDQSEPQDNQTGNQNGQQQGSDNNSSQGNQQNGSGAGNQPSVSTDGGNVSLSLDAAKDKVINMVITITITIKML
ncbi:Ig-like domain-containing protein [Pelotomaculum propionicicum]|uniref:Ig-like domain-containing protein n=1 Tax=Pelotomaculum propionicicum TaxID=258475 RepID=UPI003B7E5B60